MDRVQLVVQRPVVGDHGRGVPKAKYNKALVGKCLLRRVSEYKFFQDNHLYDLVPRLRALEVSLKKLILRHQRT
jgi:hypothetical protein